MPSLHRSVYDRPQDFLFVRPRLQLKRKRITLSSGDVGSRKGKRKVAAGLYLNYYNAHVAEANLAYEVLDPLPGKQKSKCRLQDTTVLGVSWTTQEKELFFRSLSRHGKSSAKLISSDIKTKSVLEVLGYIQVLDSAYSKLRHEVSSNTRYNPERFGLLNYVHLPAAAEISETAITAESRKSKILSDYIDSRIHSLECQKIGWSVIDLETAEEIDNEVEIMDEKALNLLTRISPDLVLLNASQMLRLSHTLRLLSPDRIRGDGKAADTIYRTTISEMYQVLATLTKSLLSTSANLSKSRINAEKSAYFQDKVRFKAPDFISELDVWSACELLNLPIRRVEWAKSAERKAIELLDRFAEQKQNDNMQHDDSVLQSQNDTENRDELEELDEEEEEDDDDTEQDEEDQLTELLDRYDRRTSTLLENQYRPFLDLRIALPVPSQLNAHEFRNLERFGWHDTHESF